MLGLSFWTGTFPVAMPDSRIRMSRGKLLHTLVIFCCLVAWQFWNRFINGEASKDKIATGVRLLLNFSNNIVVCVCTASVLRRLDGLDAALCHLTKADEYIRRSGGSFSYRESYSVTLYFGLVILTPTIARLGKGYFDADITWILVGERWFSVTSHVMVYGSLNHFSFFVDCVRQRLDCINQLADHVIHWRHFQGRVKTLENLTRAYFDIASASERIARVYSLHTLCLISTSLLLLISNTYKLAIAHSAYRFVYILCFLIFSWSIVIRLVFCCSRATQQATKFNGKIYMSMIYDDQCLNNEKLLNHMLQKRRVQFSCWDLFVIDNPLILSIAATIATYLVLVQQYMEGGFLPSAKELDEF